MGILHHLQEIDGANTIQTSIWERGGNAYGVRCSQSLRITAVIGMDDKASLEEHTVQLL